MTTIAYDGKTLAADTQMTIGDTTDSTCIKIVKRGAVLAGACGTSAMCKAFRDWFIGGMRGDPPKPYHAEKSDWSYWGLIFPPQSDSFLILQEPGWNWLRAPFYATGSGGDIATGALAMGATAEEAVRVASRFDTATGGEITVLRR